MISLLQLFLIGAFLMPYYSLRYFLKNHTFKISAVIIYTATISNITTKLINGNGVKPISLANGK
jgi:hypothetical protein